MAKELKYGIDVPQIPDDEPIILFRAQDATLPGLLAVYAVMCMHRGSPPQHTDHIEALRVNIIRWQSKNKDKVKAPD